jgi:hypothetical protein
MEVSLAHQEVLDFCGGRQALLKLRHLLVNGLVLALKGREDDHEVNH